MPAIDEDNRILQTDTFRLRFTEAGLYDQFTWLDTGDNMIAYATYERLVRIARANGSTFSADDTFSFTELTPNVSAELTWVYGDGSTITIQATVHSTWIEFEITAVTLTDLTDNVVFRIYSFGPGGEPFVRPTEAIRNSGTGIGSTITLAQTGAYLKYYDDSLALGWVQDDHAGWYPYQAGSMNMALNGTVQDAGSKAATEAAMVGRKIGLYVCENRHITVSAMFDTILTELGAVMTSRAGRTSERLRNAIFITDYNAANGGVAYNTARGEAIAAAAIALGATRVWLLEQAWRDFGQKAGFDTGVDDAIAAIQAAGLECGMHVNPHMWKDTPGVGYQDGTYAGQYKACASSYPGYNTFLHWGDTGTATVPALYADMIADIIAGLAAAGFDPIIYLDSLDAQDDGYDPSSFNFALGSANATWFFEQATAIAMAAAGIRICGMSGHAGIAYMHAAGIGTRDYGNYAVPEDVDADIAYNHVQWHRYFGASSKFGWWAMKYGGNYRSTMEMWHLMAVSERCGAGWTLQGTLAEFQGAIAGGLDTVMAMRPRRRRFMKIQELVS